MGCQPLPSRHIVNERAHSCEPEVVQASYRDEAHLAQREQRRHQHEPRSIEAEEARPQVGRDADGNCAGVGEGARGWTVGMSHREDLEVLTAVEEHGPCGVEFPHHEAVRFGRGEHPDGARLRGRERAQVS